MFGLGLLGGLLGRGMIGHAITSRPMAHRSPLAGLLARKISGASGGQGSSSSPHAMPVTSAGQSEQQSEAQPQMARATEAPQQQGEAQHTEVQPRPFVQTAPKGIEEHEEQRQQAMAGEPQQPKTVTAGLLEPGPAAPPQTPRLGTDAVPRPESVVNQTESRTPVVEPAQKQFGSIPEVGVPGIADRISEAPPHHQFAQEDPNPTQPLQLTQSAYTGNAPAYRYQTAGSSTAFAPQFSYNRR